MTTYTHNLLINITGIPDNKEFHFIRTAAIFRGNSLAECEALALVVRDTWYDGEGADTINEEGTAIFSNEAEAWIEPKRLELTPEQLADVERLNAAFKTVGEPCVMVFAPDTITDLDRARLAEYLAAA